MNKYTPDTLRALGDGMTTGEVPVWTPQLYAHADAWEADVQALWLTINRLIERLEEKDNG